MYIKVWNNYDEQVFKIALKGRKVLAKSSDKQFSPKQKGGIKQIANIFLKN
jgi:hypothetical protein